MQTTQINKTIEWKNENRDNWNASNRKYKISMVKRGMIMDQKLLNKDLAMYRKTAETNPGPLRPLLY